MQGEDIKPATTIAVVFLILISIAQLVRFIFQVHIIAGGITIPVWVSLLASIVTACLAVMVWREHKG
jgi:lipopolysaccharide export LptBFGC system permease protein LptF